MSDELEEITLEEILDEMLEAQIQIVDAVSGGGKLADPEELKGRLQELQEILRGSDLDADND
jgi:hypothetical protein